MLLTAHNLTYCADLIADLRTAIGTNDEIYEFLRSAAAKYGIGFWEPGSGIIYCATTREVDTVYAGLLALGVPAHHYHGKMTGSERVAEQELYMKAGRRTVMAATVRVAGWTPTT